MPMTVDVQFDERRSHQYHLVLEGESGKTDDELLEEAVLALDEAVDFTGEAPQKFTFRVARSGSDAIITIRQKQYAQKTIWDVAENAKTKVEARGHNATYTETNGFDQARKDLLNNSKIRHDFDTTTLRP